jgi:hypothetical protein
MSWSSQPGVNKYYAGAKFDTIPAFSDLPAPPRHWIDPTARSQSTPSSPVTITTKPTAGISLDIESLFRPETSPSCDSKGKEDGRGIFKSPSLPVKPGMMSMASSSKTQEVKQGLLKAESKPMAEAAVFKTPEKLKARSTVKVPAKPQKVAMGTDTGSKNCLRTPVTPRSAPFPATPVGGSKAGAAGGISGLDLMEMLIRASSTNTQDLHSTPTPVVKRATPVKLSPCHLQLGSKDSQYKDISDHLKSILKVSA